MTHLGSKAPKQTAGGREVLQSRRSIALDEGKECLYCHAFEGDRAVSGGALRFKALKRRPRSAHIAVNTCEGSSEPVVQAEPLEAQMPAWSNNIRMPSASTPSKARLLVLGKRGSLAPLREVAGIVP